MVKNDPNRTRKVQDPTVRKAYRKQDPTLRKKPAEKLFYNHEGGKCAVKFCKPITNGELISAIVADMGLEKAKARYTRASSFKMPIVINGTRLKASSGGPKNKALLAALDKLCDT